MEKEIDLSNAIPLILCLETSQSTCSVALFRGDSLIALEEIFIDKSHSQYLTTLIQSCLDSAKCKVSELNAIALSVGPGSYTGLRVGSSTAKGLCYTLDIPLIAVDTLESMVQEVNTTAEVYCAMIDARRSEVYCALFDKNKIRITHDEAKILDENSFEDLRQNNSVLFVGSGALKWRDMCDNRFSTFIFDVDTKPTAKTLGLLAYQNWKENDFEDFASFEPKYLKEFYSPPSKKSI